MKNNFDDLLVEMNLKEKMQQEINSLKTNNNKIFKEKKFEDLNKDELFSQNAIWKVYNRKNTTKSLINGIQAESFLNLQENTRSEIIAHKTDCFLSNHLYVEFYKFNQK